MSQLDHLAANYRRHIQLTHSSSLPTPQRIWFAVYPAEDERRIQFRMGEFEMATTDAGYHWQEIDLHGRLSAWFKEIDPEELHDWFRYPQDIETYSRTGFKEHLASFLRSELAKANEPKKTVFALSGLMELFDFRHVSELLEELENAFQGFLLVFFPGEREGNTYRFLGARDGWNYLAVPILSEK